MKYDRVTFRPSVLSGTVTAPPSKSMAHRLLVCASLAEGTSTIDNLDLSQDIRATVSCCETLGARISICGRKATVRGTGGVFPFTDGPGKRDFFCNESGSTLRFFIPLALLGSGAVKGESVFLGSPTLMTRPLSVYEDLFRKRGICFTRGPESVTVSGSLESGVFGIPGNISSQFVSGLLFALPMLTGDSEIILTTELESEPYVELTRGVLADFGIRTDKTEQGYRIPGGQMYRPGQIHIEGDDSQAAFIAAAAALSAEPEGVLMTGLRRDSRQGDRAFLGILQHMGVLMQWEEGGIRVFRAGHLNGGEDIDASQTPDLVPVEAAAFCLAEGKSRIRNAARLRIKESDRLAVTAGQYTRAGAMIRETDDGLLIDGQPDGISGGTADSCGDHRIAMSLAVLAQRTEQGILVTDSGSVQKSWPTFWEDFRKIGGRFE